MTYSIIGIANRRGPESIAGFGQQHGAAITPMTLARALQADVVILAVPFRAHAEVAEALADWRAKVVIDATNAYGVALSELGDQPSSAVVARAVAGAHLVKAFNHLPAGVLAQDPESPLGRRVIFLSGDDQGAVSKVAALVRELGFAPVSLGKIAEGGRLVQPRDKTWAPLIFQDVFKKEA